MNEISEFETYLSISQNKFGIYLFDNKNRNNLYTKEITFEKTDFINHSHLKQFLDDNIFKIEKLVGKFIENIFIIIDYENILNTQIGIKQKNYQPSKSNVYLKSSWISGLPKIYGKSDTWKVLGINLPFEPTTNISLL